MSRPVTAAMAVQALEMLNLPTVTVSTIRTWADRGHVKKLGRDQYGLMKYDFLDILTKAQQKAA